MGATCNVLKESELKGTKYQWHIKPTVQVLKMYNNSSLTPLGECKIELKDPQTKKKLKVPFAIVDEKHANNDLLGCRTAQQMKLIQRICPNHTSNQVNRDHNMPSLM